MMGLSCIKLRRLWKTELRGREFRFGVTDSIGLVLIHPKDDTEGYIIPTFECILGAWRTLLLLGRFEGEHDVSTMGTAMYIANAIPEAILSEDLQVTVKNLREKLTDAVIAEVMTEKVPDDLIEVVAFLHSYCPDFPLGATYASMHEAIGKGLLEWKDEFRAFGCPTPEMFRKAKELSPPIIERFGEHLKVLERTLSGITFAHLCAMHSRVGRVPDAVLYATAIIMAMIDMKRRDAGMPNISYKVVFKAEMASLLATAADYALTAFPSKSSLRQDFFTEVITFFKEVAVEKTVRVKKK